MAAEKKTKRPGAGKRLVERSPSQMKFILGALTLALVAFGTAYMLGTKSSGQINVASTIQEGERLDPTREKINPNVRATVPNGGLVPTNPAPTPTNPPPEEEAAAASSTDETSTSTEEGVEETAEDTVDDETQTSEDTEGGADEQTEENTEGESGASEGVDESSEDTTDAPDAADSAAGGA